MKLFFTTVSFLAVFTAVHGQWYFSSLELTPTDSMRIDSLAKEIDYRLNTEQYLPLSIEEAMAKSVDEIRQIIPPDKLDKFEALLHTDIRTIDTSGFYGFGLSDGQSDSLSQFRELQRLRYDNKSVAEEEMEFEAYEYSLLTPEQRMQYPAYQNLMKKGDIGSIRFRVNQIAPGLEISESEAATIKLMVDQETRDYLLEIEMAEEEQRFTFYRSKLKVIISPKRLTQLDQAFKNRENIKHRIALEEDSIAYAAKLQQLTVFCKWWSENLKAAYEQLQKQYTTVIPERLKPELDSIRKLEEEYFMAVFNQANFRKREQNPLYFEFLLLEMKQLQRFPNLRQTIDGTESKQDFYYSVNPDFIKYRQEIIASIEPEVYKTLSVELLRLEKIQHHFMEQSAPDLLPEWFPESPVSILVPNRILNFLLSMPDR